MTRPEGPPRLVVDAVRALSRALVAVSRRLAPTPIPLLDLVSGYWRAQALGAITRLGVADALAGGPRDVTDLARECDVQEEPLFRVLRALASDGLLARPAPRCFGLNAVSAPLRRDHPRSLHHAVRMMTAPWQAETWSRLADTVRDGVPAFQRLHGADLWTWLQTRPEEARDFHRAMRELTRVDLDALLPAYDFGRHASVVDVGGGAGTLLAGVLGAFPNVRGVVLDLPEATRDADATLRAAGVRERAEVVHGSFLEAIPAGHDAYLLRQIVHGLSEPELPRLFDALRAALAPGARLLVIEMLVPEEASGSEPSFLDLQMLIGSGGRERTRAEYAALFARHGMRLVEVVRTASPAAIFVAERA